MASSKKNSSAKRNLIYTVALEGEDSNAYQTMAKLLVSSLIRTAFSGDVLVFHNSPRPLFEAPRDRVREEYVDTEDVLDFGEHGTRFKAKASQLIDASQYDRIMFIDCDCLVLHNVDALFSSSDGVINYAREPGHAIGNDQFNSYLTDEELKLERDGVNSGVWMVKARQFDDLMSRWTQIDEGPAQRPRHCYDQPAWNRIVLDAGKKARPFPLGVVQYPIAFDPNYEHYRDADILHFCAGIPASVKLEFQFGVYCARFLSDKASHLIDMLEP